MISSEIIIQKLNKVLKGKNISQRKLAEELDVHEDLISKWKLKKSFPSRKNLDRLEIMLTKLGV